MAAILNVSTEEVKQSKDHVKLIKLERIIKNQFLIFLPSEFNYAEAREDGEGLKFVNKKLKIRSVWIERTL